MFILILAILGWFSYFLTAFNTGSFNGMSPSMLPGSLRHKVSVILTKHELKQLLISLSADMMVSSSRRTILSLVLDCSETIGLIVFQKTLSLPTTVGSKLA